MLTSNGCESEIELLAVQTPKLTGKTMFQTFFLGGMADLCSFLEDMCQIFYDGRVVCQLLIQYIIEN